MKVLDKIFVVVAAVSGFLIISQWSYSIYLRYQYNVIVNNAAAIGIIGSSNGPTSIFISNYAWEFLTFVSKFAYITLLFSVGLLATRKIRYSRRK